MAVARSCGLAKPAKGYKAAPLSGKAALAQQLEPVDEASPRRHKPVPGRNADSTCACITSLCATSRTRNFAQCSSMYPRPMSSSSTRCARLDTPICQQRKSVGVALCRSGARSGPRDLNAHQDGINKKGCPWAAFVGSSAHSHWTEKCH